MLTPIRICQLLKLLEVGFLLLAVYWFNPILWIAYVLFCRDIEAACDEKVIEDFDRQWKVKYSEALLSCAVERRMITVCPLAFGETNVKGRVKGVLSMKKLYSFNFSLGIYDSDADRMYFYELDT